MASKRIRHWVLRDAVSGKYFMQWTGSGPACCAELEKAKRFRTKIAALQSPASSFALTLFKPHPVRRR